MTLLQSLLICIFILSPLHASVITLYPGSTTYIYEQYPIANTGTNTGLVSALPAGISPIEISATGLTSASFFPESQVSDFLAARIGRSVQLEKSGLNEGPYIFKGLFDSSYVLQKKDEIRFVPKDTPLIFEKADLPKFFIQKILSRVVEQGRKKGIDMRDLTCRSVHDEYSVVGCFE